MLSNYLKITIRTLWKDKGFSFINIVGLAIGISTCVLISLYTDLALCFVSSFAVAWLAWSFQTIKAALANPVNSLRNE